MGKLLFILISSLASLSTQAQISLLKGIVVDPSTNAPIANVRIQQKGKNTFFTSDDKGQFFIKNSAFPLELIFSHVSYESKEIKIYQNQFMYVDLIMKNNLINEIAISSKAEIKKFDLPKTLWAVDYEFFDPERILLLVNKNVLLGKSILLLINEEGDSLSSMVLSNKSERLSKDCLGNIYLHTKDEIAKIEIENNQITYTVLALHNYQSSIENCVATINDFLYYKQLHTKDYGVNYYIFDQEKQQSKLFCQVLDSAGIRLYKAEQEFLACITDPFDLFVEEAYAQNVLFKAVNAPLIENHHQLYLFNFPQNQIEHYSSTGYMRNKTQIEFHKSKHWEEQLIIDHYSHKIYTLYAQWGNYWLTEINPQTGLSSNKTTIPDFIFIDNIKVYNDTLYFLYRDRTTYENLALYSMKL